MSAEQLARQDELALANGLFAWLQATHEDGPPILSETAHSRLTEVFQVDPQDLPAVRDLLNQQPPDHVLPLRLYISGFEESIVRQLDADEVLNQAVFSFVEQHREHVHPAPQVEPEVTPEPPVPVIEISPKPAAIARAGVRRARPRIPVNKQPVVRAPQRHKATPTASKPELPGDLQVPFDIKDADAEQKLTHVPLDGDNIKQWLKEIGKVPLLNAEQEVELTKSIEAGLLAEERLEQLGDELTAEQRSELEVLVQLGQSSYERMLVSNLRLVVSIAKRYNGRGLAFLDLAQEGNLGLIRAVQKYDYTKGFKFSTYATWWVRQAIVRALADQGRAIRLPVHVVEARNRIGAYKRQFVVDMGREPTANEIASEFNMSIEEVTDFHNYTLPIISLETPLDDDGHELQDIFADESAGSDVGRAGSAFVVSDAIERALETLTERENTVIRMRLGLNDGQPRTLDEVGKVLGVTKERVRQIEAKTMSKLRHPSRSHLLTGLM